jgi:hypothetical protein
MTIGSKCRSTKSKHGVKMKREFVGAALPVDQPGFEAVLQMLLTGPAEMWSVLTVETAGCGFDPIGRPRILFERHKFSAATGGRYDVDYPDISNPQPGGYGNLDTQYERLGRAIALERSAALNSTSWGIAQIMGFNATSAGYANVEAMVAAMMDSESNQLLAMAHFLKSSKLDVPLRQRDWAAFAAGYNGPAYEKNQYGVRLQIAYSEFSVGRLPDLQARATQMLLTYLGYQPGPIDGFPGKNTMDALRVFFAHEQLDVKETIDDAVLNELKTCVARENAMQDSSVSNESAPQSAEKK